MDVFQKFQFQGDLRRFQTELQTNYLFVISYMFEFFFREYIYFESTSSCNLVKRTLDVIKKYIQIFNYVENSNSNFMKEYIILFKIIF